MVSSYQTGGSAGASSIPMDQFSLNFAKVSYEYMPQKAVTMDPMPTLYMDLTTDGIQFNK